MTLRHPDFYFPDGTVVFNLENKHYRLHSHLLDKSRMLQQKLNFAGLAEKGPYAGLTITLDEGPVSTESFEYFLKWFYNHTVVQDTEALMGILEVSHYLQVDEGRAFAIDELGERDINPVAKLIIAQAYHIPDWVANSFRTLLTKQLSFEEYHELGMDNLYLLHDTQNKVRMQRSRVAYHPPPSQHIHQCRRQARRDCERYWKDDWWQFFAHKAFDPNLYVTSSEAFRTFQDAHGGRMTECRRLSLSSVLNGGILREDEQIIENAILQLRDTCI